jgi:hypothetical protein
MAASDFARYTIIFLARLLTIEQRTPTLLVIGRLLPNSAVHHGDQIKERIRRKESISISFLSQHPKTEAGYGYAVVVSGYH